MFFEKVNYADALKYLNPLRIKGKEKEEKGEEKGDATL
jgi:hypothetical protein